MVSQRLLRLTSFQPLEMEDDFEIWKLQGMGGAYFISSATEETTGIGATAEGSNEELNLRLASRAAALHYARMYPLPHPHILASLIRLSSNL